VKARYVLGLTATPMRKDGHHRIIYMQCGPIRYRMSVRTMTEANPFEHVVIPWPTDFQMGGDVGNITFQDIYADLVSNDPRNEMIAQDLVRAVRAGRSPLLLTGRTEHLGVFAGKLSGLVKNVFILRGGLRSKQRRAIAEQLAAVQEGEQRVILATGSYIGEGFDDARLDTLFLAMLISWKGTLQQYVGRLHWLHDSKRVVEVYYYIDGNVRMLARIYERRLRGYGDMGYKILETVEQVLYFCYSCS
jgi:superfamily II DNA or RNA helicase